MTSYFILRVSVLFQMNQLDGSGLRPNELRHISSFPNGRNRGPLFLQGYEGLMKIPRQYFVEVVWLYQNGSEKAMVISGQEMGYGPEYGFLDLSQFLWCPVENRL